MMSDLQHLSATDAIANIKAGKFCVTDWVQSCLNQIERLDKTLKAWVYLDPVSALRQAKVVDDAIAAGKPTGALCGAPVGVKDIFNTKDMPTQMGSPIWKDFTPGNDARVVHYLRMAGGIIPGKTVTAEFAVHTPGPTLNPHNPEYMAGTSSTGSAVAVASYMVPLALGTQTAGSIIRPASYCGVYGFKPSFGLIPRTGMLKTTDSLDTVGFFARTVEDLALLFEVIRVHGLDYPISNAELGAPAHQGKGMERPWKVAIAHGPKWDHAETYAHDALFSFVAELQRVSGVIVDEVSLPESLNSAHDIHSTIYDRTLAYYFKDEFKQNTLVSRIMYDIIKRGNQISLEQYKAALDKQTKLASELDAFFISGYDLLIDLSTGGEALRGLDSPDRPDNCLIWTLGGVPTINLPLFTGPNGLPFGAQVITRRYSDYLLLDFVRFLRDRGLIQEAPNPSLRSRI